MPTTMTEPRITSNQHPSIFLSRILPQEKTTHYKGPSSEEIQELFGDALESTRKLHHGFSWEPGYIPHPHINPSRN